MFGEFVRNLRLDKRISLRQFCTELGYDASNWSKIERGVLPPPKAPQRLEEIAELLGLKRGEEAWERLFDLASIERGEIPKDLAHDEELIAKLPSFFRTLRGQKPNRSELEKMAEMLRRS